MADTEPLSKVGASASITSFVSAVNLLIDGRNKWNITDVTDTDLSLGTDGNEGLIVVTAATATCDIDLPASSAAPGLCVVVYAADATNTVTIVRDGTDTINGASSDPTLAVNTGKVLISIGTGGWLMWSIP